VQQAADAQRFGAVLRSRAGRASAADSAGCRAVALAPSPSMAWASVRRGAPRRTGTRATTRFNGTNRSRTTLRATGLAFQVEGAP
jgi:hypothetical protein